MTVVRGTRLDALDREALAAGVETVRPPLVDAVAGTGPDRVLLLPDVHYPYHPSTGMVTNPDLVAALRSALAARLPRTEVAVAVRSQPPVDTGRTVDYLGYDDRDDLDAADLLVLDDARVDVTGIAGAAAENGADGDRSPVALQEPLSEAAVVPVPSARVAGAVPVAGSLALVAAAVGADPTNPEAVERAVRAVDPAGAVVDATYAFAGEPYRARALLCSDAVGAADAVLAELLGVDAGEVPGLPAVGVGTDGPVSVAGLDAAALAADLPDGGLPATTDPHPLVRAGYRLYTRVSGDVYPPQLGRR